jgi:hypothetical protein
MRDSRCLTVPPLIHAPAMITADSGCGELCTMQIALNSAATASVIRFPKRHYRRAQNPVECVSERSCSALVASLSPTMSTTWKYPHCAGR